MTTVLDTPVPEPKEFPACAILGYGLDFTTASPVDLKALLAAVKTGRRIIEYSPDEDTRNLEVDGVLYAVPKCIGVTDYNSGDGNYVTFKSGVEAASKLKVDTSLSGRYQAVSASASVSYSIDKTYRREDQWAMYSFNSDSYLASLRNYYGLLAETQLLERLEGMQPIGTGSNEGVVQDWKDFFDNWGSHVIINSAYGARFQLNVWASNSDSSVNQRFSVNVTAAFNGIGSGGKFNASVKDEEQYQTFMAFMQKQVSIVGGNPEISKQLTADPTQNDVFVKWAGTVAQDSSLMTMNVVALWFLMKEANMKGVRDAAGMVMDAYNYIVSHPQPYKTAVILDIQSDWAEFNLLAPEAVIIPDDNHPFPFDTVVSNTRVRWGKPSVFERKTLQFYVVNDGSPINFSTSHGSDGAQPKEGRVDAIIETVNYPNDEITDNVWNTKWFYKTPVSDIPASTKFDPARTEHKWDTVLREYLEEIGAGGWI